MERCKKKMDTKLKLYKLLLHFYLMVIKLNTSLVIQQNLLGF
jgi:hypothetical protein